MEWLCKGIACDLKICWYEKLDLVVRELTACPPILVILDMELTSRCMD